ncbi:MAG: TetR/AcrR family transcriptional regulator, partial [Acidimicrobiia bacterium]|nr:TetR/AcrR family transcriptional regulator [Acidimicrobiia bacterium]
RGDPDLGVAAERRSDELQDLVSDGPALIAAWGELMVEVAPRVSPILLLLRDVAAHDPSASMLFAELETDRLTRMADNARALDRLGALRRGVSRAAARDIMWTYTAPDLYDVLVRRRGWSVRRYARLVVEGMTAALL